MSGREMLIGFGVWLVAAVSLAQSPLERLEQGLGTAPPAVDDSGLTRDAPLPPDPGTNRQPVAGQVSVYLGLSAIEDVGGIRIEGVVPGGPASQGGLQPGMQILSVGRQPVTAMRDFATVLTRVQPGDAIEFEVQGRPEPLVVTAAAAADRPTLPRNATDRDWQRIVELLEARIEALEGRVRVLELRIRELETTASGGGPATPLSESPSSRP